MRLLGLVVGVCLLFGAAPAMAAPPLDPDRFGGKRDGSRAGTPFRIPQRAPGVDAAEQVRAGTSGTYKAVVILLQFSDNPADTINHSPAAFADLLFSVGTHPTGSMRDYYREVSRDQFDIDGIVTRWYTAPQPYSFYVNGQSGFGLPPQNSQGMTDAALQLADPDVNFSQFDNDGPDGMPNSGDDDGFIDALFIVHAGPGGEETGSVDQMWSHKFTVPGLLIDGVRAGAFTTEPEEWANTTTYSTAGELISIGVFCHEFGHVLGLPDLYDTTDSPTSSEGVGEWDLMSTGVYTHGVAGTYGSTPAHMSAWSKIRLGWVTPTWVLQDSAGVTIPPVENSGQVFRLWTNGADDGEYFLVENRQPIGFDAGLVRSSIEAGDGPSHGLIIYHVDDTIFDNNNATHKRLDVEEAGGPEGQPGVQNLDVHRNTTVLQNACGQNVLVTGNRADRFDPWPGPQNATSFDGSCPPSGSYCANKPSQVAVRNIVETGNDVTVDFFVNGVTVHRLAIAVDDTPFGGFPNNGNGLVEPGETVRLRFPLQNYASNPTGPLTARLQSESYLTLNPDSIMYASIGPGATDSGSVVQATILPTPDPRGVNVSLPIFAAAGLVDIDSVQVLVGGKTGICDNFENTLRRWVASAGGCDGINEWRREAGAGGNHTPGGTWAWRLGPPPPGTIGSYSPLQDARLMSQPIRLAGIADTLVFWQRYDSEVAFDGLSMEISTDGAETWTLLTPVGGYPNGDRWSGFQPAFVEAKVPLTGYSGIIQLAFRFQSSPANGGLGWWIDDVAVTGDDQCATTDIAITRFDAASIAGRSAVRVAWGLSDGIGGTVGIDRALGAEQRHRIATLPWDTRAGEYEDIDVVPGFTYKYWLTASRFGEPDATAGPVLVAIPSGVGEGTPPRVLAMSRVRPNPFSPNASFSVALDRDGPYVVRVFRADGSLVRTLADARGRAGTVPFTWDGTDERGRPVGAGLYFFELRAESGVRVQKAVLLR